MVPFGTWPFCLTDLPFDFCCVPVLLSSTRVDAQRPCLRAPLPQSTLFVDAAMHGSKGLAHRRREAGNNIIQ